MPPLSTTQLMTDEYVKQDDAGTNFGDGDAVTHNLRAGGTPPAQRFIAFRPNHGDGDSGNVPNQSIGSLSAGQNSPVGTTLFGARIITLANNAYDSSRSVTIGVITDRDASNVLNYANAWEEHANNWTKLLIERSYEQFTLQSAGVPNSRVRGVLSPTGWASGENIWIDVTDWLTRRSSAAVAAPGSPSPRIYHNGFWISMNSASATDRLFEDRSGTAPDPYVAVYWGENLTGLTGSAGSSRIDASWDSSSGADQYDIYLDNVLQTSIGGLSYSFTGLNPGQTYNVRVVPIYFFNGGNSAAASQNFNIMTVALVAQSSQSDVSIDLTIPRSTQSDAEIDIIILRSASADFDADILQPISTQSDFSLDLSKVRSSLVDFDLWVGQALRTIVYKTYTPIEGVIVDAIFSGDLHVQVSNDGGATWVEATDMVRRPFSTSDGKRNLLRGSEFNTGLEPRVYDSAWRWQSVEYSSPPGAAELYLPSPNATTAHEMVNEYEVPNSQILRNARVQLLAEMFLYNQDGLDTSEGKSTLQFSYRDGSFGPIETLVTWDILNASWNSYIQEFESEANKDIASILVRHTWPGGTFPVYSNPLSVFVDRELLYVVEHADDTAFRAVQFPTPGNDLCMELRFASPQTTLSRIEMTPLYTSR